MILFRNFARKQVHLFESYIMSSSPVHISGFPIELKTATYMTLLATINKVQISTIILKLI